MLAGCSGTGGNPFLKSKKAPDPPAPQDQPMAPPPVPYALTAQASGAFIQFSITNTSQSPIEIAPSMFALIPQGRRQVVPYGGETATIDSPRVVQPGQTVTGRAFFREFRDPAGSRLVFKPDAYGTFATIGGSTFPLVGAAGIPRG